MASEIYRERIYGNFKTPKAQLLAEKNRDDHDDREGNSKKHLAAMRKLPCCVPSCNIVGVDPHHLKSGTGTRGMGLRSTDKFTVPLCRHHHEEVERIGTKNETRWFQEMGIDPIALAFSLFGVSPKAEQMTNVVLAYKAAGKGDI